MHNKFFSKSAISLIFTLVFNMTLALPLLAADIPQTMEQKAAYAIGINFVNSLKMQGVNLDKARLMQGIEDALSGKLVLSQNEMQTALNDFKAQLMIQQQLVQKTQSSQNKQQGAAFLANNKKQPGVVTLPSGLQYKIIKQGSGPTPKLSDKVTTHYRGTLIDGTEFDSSYSRNKPATFPVNGVIKGWTEALQLMHKGDKWQLFIPSTLAYGDRAVGDKIEPGSTLIFDIELLNIN